MTTPTTIPKTFVWRKLHSLTGLWLVGFVIFHLLTNSQAALLFGHDGNGFIRSVNSIHEQPFLPVIEIAILAVPILLHGIWGIVYLRQAKYNSFGDDGKTPYLPEYPRNHAYTWQRITSWLLLVGIIAHVVHMRFINYPESMTRIATHERTAHMYMVRISDDKGLETLSKRLGVEIYNSPQGANLSPELLKSPLKQGEVIAVADNFGTAELLMVRDTFKSPVMIALYTLLVLATCFHAFNGLWTAMIAWGITLSQRSQRLMRTLSTILMVVVAFLGLSAVWLTYWINLKQ